MRNSRIKNRKGKTVFYIILLAFAIFLLISLLFYHLHLPQAIGKLGLAISSFLIFYLGYCVYSVPIFLIIVAWKQLGWKLTARDILSVSIWLLAISLFCSDISFAIGKVLPTNNYGGVIGAWLSRVLFQNCGIVFTFFIPLFLLYSIIPTLKNQRLKPYLTNGLFAFILIALVQASIALLLPSSHWKLIEDKYLLVAGNITIKIVEGIRYLIGFWGTLIALLCGWIVFILVYSHVYQIIKAIGLFLKKLLLGIGEKLWWLFKKLLNFIKSAFVFQKPKIKEKRAKPGIVTETTVQLETPQKLSEPIIEPVEQKKPEVKKAETKTTFDEQEFQKEFLSCLDIPSEERLTVDQKILEQEAEVLIEKLKEFGIDCKVTNILTGPMITRFEIEPAPGIKIQRIESLADDLALSLKAERIRILAPIPGKAAVGIEVPNKYRRIVYLRDVLVSEEYTANPSPLTFAIGETITGEPYAADLREMPHVLIAGTTGSGKSVCINTMITSIIFRSSYKDVRFLTIDPKQLELPIYNSIPHLLNPTTIDPKHAIKELDRVIGIMEARYGIFANLGVRDIAGYNQVAQMEGLEKKPYIVVVIDELADLMCRAPAEIEDKIIRLAQMSRAVGIHLVLATQRPSVDVITGLIKANFPCRIAFQVASKTDSRTILDMNGAEALLGRGDMLFLPPGKGEPIRLHCAYVSAQATKRVVDLWTRRYITELLSDLVPDPEEKAKEIIAKQVTDVLIDKEKASLKRKQEAFYSIIPEDIAEILWQQEYHKPLSEELDLPQRSKSDIIGQDREVDELLENAARIVFQHREASVSMLQRRLDIGWARAGRIIDQLEQLGIVGPYVGSKSRKVIVQSEEELEKILAMVRKPNV
ncbi:MAG: DNA translocase FtsK 4TM domain-containing protein [candidate division WOR-3 bacterium]|nr:DNA translocase FtsK 4TM domain-containing protein [candidate division WOR-3 bacterium]